MSERGVVLSAAWVFPVTAEPIANGAVSIRENRIEAVGKKDDLLEQFERQGYEERHYINGAILPGLINLHSHIDYSHQRFLNSHSSLFDWILQLMGSVRGWTNEDFLRSAQYGAALMALSGITTIADSSYSGMAAEAIANLGLRGTVALEIFGLDNSQADRSWDFWLSRLDERNAKASSALKEALREGRMRLTVSPHSPYTVAPALWEKARDWSESTSLPMLAHVAEAQLECLWVRDHAQEVNDYLLKVMPSGNGRDTTAILAAIDWKGHGHSPAAHLEKHELLTNNTIAAHCVQLDDDDIRIFKTIGVSIAHCPRSNARLRHGRAPLEKFLEHGLTVGLGTDSLASNDDLNILHDAAFALNLHRAAVPNLKLTSTEVLSMMTIDSARALGQSNDIGSLSAGKKADLAIFKLKDWPAHLREETGSFGGDPADLVIRGTVELEDLFVDGKVIVSSGRLRNSAVTNK